MVLSLRELVDDFAAGLQAADEDKPVHASRSGRVYQPGVGPLPESRAVALALQHMRGSNPDRYIEAGHNLLYPSGRQRADLWVGDGPSWVVEVKLFRPLGDNGKPDDTCIKNMLSPYPAHRSALTDAIKLSESGFDSSRAIIVYGFESDELPMEDCMVALEILSKHFVVLRNRYFATFGPLVHPVHRHGAVYGWEIGPRTFAGTPA